MARQSLIASALDLLFPPRCVGCHRRGSWLCAACRATLRVPPDERCPLCARPVAGAAVCPGCRRDRPTYDRLHCGFMFEGAVREAIHHLKYRGARHLAEPLAQLLTESVTGFDTTTVIVPVPLHPNRLARRGYNQSALLARAIGAELGLAVTDDRLRRIRDTPAQVSLSGVQRRANVRGAFDAAPGAFTGDSILLVDDVATTGSTLHAAALALKEAGAARIDAVVVARAP